MDIAQDVNGITCLTNDTPMIDRSSLPDGDNKIIIVANLLPSTSQVLHPGKELESNPTAYPVHYRHYHYLFPSFSGVDTLAVGTLTRKNLSGTGDDHLQEVQDSLVHGHGCMPVFLEDSSYDLFYNTFCKEFLYPKLHSLPGPNVMNKAAWQAYCDVNAAFARVVVSVYKPGDVIWINDYHLALLPHLLRTELPGATIGFFLHTPFPSSEIFRSIPVREEILSSMLGANLIAFQNFEYVRHFISSCTRLVGVEAEPHRVVCPARGSIGEFPVSVSVMPIGIDRERVEEYLGTESFEQARRQYDKEFKGLKVIAGYDRIDAVKGLKHKLIIFRKMLEEYPEMVGKAVLVQVAVATSQSAEHHKELNQLAGEINGEFGSVSYAPVHFHTSSITWTEQLALFSRADVLLVTSIRDGMNLTPAEYVLCQGSKGTGCAVVSEFAGTAESLCGASLINPWDYAGSAVALKKAIDVSGTRFAAARMADMHSYVTHHSATAWGSRFIHELFRAGELYRASLQELPPLKTSKVVSDFRQAKKRLLLLDYDGTLTPIQKLPELATPPPAILDVLTALSDQGKSGDGEEETIVYVVSGRDKPSLTHFLGKLSVGLSAEHGGHLRAPGGPHMPWESFLESLDLSWMPVVREVFEYYTERTPGSHIEVKVATLCWHYRNAEETHAQWQANELRNHLEETVVGHFPVNVLVGKKTIEVRPKSIDKGVVVRRIMESHPDADFVFCVGDDRTDEDMFRVVRELEKPGVSAHNVIIGLKNTPNAKGFLEDTTSLSNLLHEFAGMGGNSTLTG